MTRDSHTPCFFISQKFQQCRPSSVPCQYVENRIPGVVVPIIHAIPRVIIADIPLDTTGQFAHFSENRAEIFSDMSLLHSTSTTPRLNHSQTSVLYDHEIKLPCSFPGTPPRQQQHGEFLNTSRALICLTAQSNAEASNISTQAAEKTTQEPFSMAFTATTVRIPPGIQ